MSAAVLAGLAAVPAAWVAGIAIAWACQDRIVFGKPWRVKQAPLGPHGEHRTERVELTTADGVVLEGWVAIPPRARRVVVWFGGRNENVAWTPALASWLGPDWATCAFNYRGCAGSTGCPSQDRCTEDGIAIVRWAQALVSAGGAQTVLMGRSLGSAVAMQVQARLAQAGSEPAFAGLVLLAPPASIRALVLANPLLAPAVGLLRHPFASIDLAGSVRSPCLILLAQLDRQVPHRHSYRLAEQIAGSETVTVHGTHHNSLPRDARSLSHLAEFANKHATSV